MTVSKDLEKLFGPKFRGQKFEVENKSIFENKFISDFVCFFRSDQCVYSEISSLFCKMGFFQKTEILGPNEDPGNSPILLRLHGL